MDSITVKVAQVPGQIKDIALANGYCNVKSALEAAEIDIARLNVADVKVNGRTITSFDETLVNGAYVMVCKSIKGN